MTGTAARRLATLIVLAAFANAYAAPAQTTDPANPTCPPNPNWSTNAQMTFRVVERPGDRPVLIAEGGIDEGLIPRLQAALSTFQGNEIWLRSAGGDARTGNQAGRLIHASGIATRIPAGWACNGACAFMFMGGVVRAVEPDGLFILQPTTFTGSGDRSQVAQAAAQQATEDNDFLMRMGVARTLLSEVLYRSGDGSTRRCLTQAELVRYNVTNH